MSEPAIVASGNDRQPLGQKSGFPCCELAFYASAAQKQNGDVTLCAPRHPEISSELGGRIACPGRFTP
ncbi:hypothetical protein MES5069_270238 [Mesorhizobium escarrei]|uniref:Uncharacterized protein n=1 Tax=Mesorhizobium escarrei TaxID=666018 RepID=A0ABM9DWG2_9HYPH|nr:hypothetical protein MES5069_270238 [Mesorhizobium escarrei]